MSLVACFCLVVGCFSCRLLLSHRRQPRHGGESSAAAVAVAAAVAIATAVCCRSFCCIVFDVFCSVAAFARCMKKSLQS